MTCGFPACRNTTVIEYEGQGYCKEHTPPVTPCGDGHLDWRRSYWVNWACRGCCGAGIGKEGR